MVMEVNLQEEEELVQVEVRPVVDQVLEVVVN